MDLPVITKQRLPSGKACVNCRKRKNRCCGARPQCSTCIARGILCCYPDIAAEKLSVDELQKLMTAKLRESGVHPRSTDSARRQGPQADSTDSVHGEGHIAPTAPSMAQSSFGYADSMASADPSDAASRGNSPAISAAATARTGSTARDSSPREASPSDPQEPDGYFGESSTFAFVSNVSSGQTQQQRRKRRRLSRTASAPSPGLDAGLTPGTDTTACYELPPKHVADGLVDAFFAHVHRLYPFVHEPSFRRDYERMWALQPRTIAEQQQHPLWFGLLNLVFAHGYEFCDAAPVTEPVVLSSQFLQRARRIVFAHLFTAGSFELVQALLLLCHYLQSTLELNECWALVGLMIHTAVGLGLHFNPPAADGLTAVDREIRKRVWWGCYIIDRTLSMKFGRPPSMQGRSTFDIDMPVEVDDQYISRDFVVPRQPEGRPSLIAFFTQTIKLADIVENVLLDLYQPRRTVDAGDKTAPQGTMHSQITGRAVLLDGSLLAWWEAVPAHLKDESLFFDGPEFRLQRNVLHIRFLNLRLIIHRQAFLVFSKQDINDPLQQAVAVASSRACISAARTTIRLIHSQYRHRLLNSLWYNLHYVFTSMGVLLALRTLDTQKMEALGETHEDDTLDLGMDFLRAASTTSALAARYTSMLQRIRTRPIDDAATGPPQAAAGPEPTDNIHAPPLPLDPQNGTTPWLLGPSDDLGFFGDPALVDLNDLLFGTGLPRDLLSTEWPTFRLMP
ncbi:Transcription factor [Niveomyces insectorum RCEF 264]|uniref:Transcription factor n=1 Tax=Niveomyces insectorum RCEF 264 TaxID=1081102 RepID=A0A162MKR5_9HYPO|nr:Transcription factor [Niveomyces insectorum RCEF 264]